jgi:predicted transcriptional regulator
MKTLRVGIASYDEIKARTVAIARGQDQPVPGEPKTWFTSPESFARVVSEQNRELLRIISERPIDSTERLSEVTGRTPAEISRALKMLERYGLVRVRRGAGKLGVLRVTYDAIALVMPLGKTIQTRRAGFAG